MKQCNLPGCKISIFTQTHLTYSRLQTILQQKTYQAQSYHNNTFLIFVTINT